MNILRLSCEDKAGIVAAVATTLRDNQCNIEESSQFHDPHSNQFYMRVVFSAQESGSSEKFKDNFKAVADDFAMSWQICDASAPLKTMIMVSQHDHCLNDILYRHKSGLLPIEITAIVSNHEVTREMVENHGLPFHYLPVTSENKDVQEQSVRELIKSTNSELIVMARYMQILSEDFCHDYLGRVINIHHSFLPGFKGARPYHQAYERGVKIIGATAHFATADLDEGPIIAQDIVPIDHSYTPQKLQALGQDTESRVLARAIRLYAERRIFQNDPQNGRRTIIL